MCNLMFVRTGVAPLVFAVAVSFWIAATAPAPGQEPGKTFNINIASIILVEPDIETALPIQIAPAEAVPKNSFLRLRGLPASVTLSLGHQVSPGSWAVPLSALPTLKLTAPKTANTKSQVSVSLVSVDGTVWAETKASLVVMAASSLPGAPQAATPAPSATVAAIRPTAPPQSSAPPPAAAPPPKPPEDPRAVALLDKGEELLKDGDVAGARLFFKRAVDRGLARAAIALAETYDPNELSRLGVRGMEPDIKMAQQWYEKAASLGDTSAAERLRRLSQR